MEDIIKGFLPAAININYLEMFFKMFLSTVIGALIAFHISSYKITLYKCEKLKLAKAQIILCLVGTIMVIVIGDNVARAFGLFGLGSFIRFRTAIKDALDTSVIFLLIGIGMAIGVSLYIPAIMVFIFLYIILFLLSFLKTQEEKSDYHKIKSEVLKMNKTVVAASPFDAKTISAKLYKSPKKEKFVSQKIASELDENTVIQPKKKVCPVCGEKSKQKTMFCKHCGSKFESVNNLDINDTLLSVGKESNTFDYIGGSNEES